MSDNPMQWTQTTPTISRLDYMATAIYAAFAAHQAIDIDPAYAVELAKGLIAAITKAEEDTP